MKFLIVLLVLILSIQANACDCDSIKGLKEADAVFNGKVLKVQRIEEPYIRYEITFQVSQWIKGGKRNKTVVVDTKCLQEACCVIAFQVDDVYEVFAFFKDNRLKTTYCWETNKIK